MNIENTDLERRVLAHERILKVLIGHMAETEPKFLARLKEQFTNQQQHGAHEQDYTDTDAYAERFVHDVVRAGRRPQDLR